MIKKKNNPFDFYNVEELFDDDEKLIQKTVREFIRRELLDVIADCYEKAEFPKKLIPQVGKLGLLGANLQGYGCAGLNNTAYGLILQELERGDSGLRSFVSVQGSLVMYPIYAFGSDAQKEKWLPLLQKGHAIGCFGLTEPDAGSDPGSMKTKAIRKKNSYVLNGSKAWITNGTVADVAVVWAQTDDGIRGFLVEKGTPGFEAKDIKGKLALRASVTSVLYFSDCEIPAENLLPKTQGLKSALMCLNQARYGISWGVIGAALACYEQALSYCEQRKIFGKPLSSFQMIQEKLAWMVTEITKAQLLVWRLSKLKDNDHITPAQISLAKRNNCWMALEIARMSRDMLGANGTAYEYVVGRHMCNLEAVKTYEGTHDIHTLVLGEALTGHSAFGNK
ncbi:MAG: acyl-CoA dehydrogenase family protein [Deltaproteobacteria bacterium]|nr:acyl-CoA dehydrogenase family protein [Deltaproteobacteria bacterium]